VVARSSPGEFFGFHDISGELTGIAGPALFATLGQLTGLSGLSIVALMVFFIDGIFVLTLVDEAGGIHVAQQESREMGLGTSTSRTPNA